MAGHHQLAEAVRFELTDGVSRRRFSRPVHSTALPHLRSILSPKPTASGQACNLTKSSAEIHVLLDDHIPHEVEEDRRHDDAQRNVEELFELFVIHRLLLRDSGRSKLAHDRSHALDELIGFAARNDEARHDANHVARGHGEEHAVLEAKREAPMRETIKNDADHEAAAAHLNEARHVGERLAELVLQILAHDGGVLDELFVFHD